MERRGKKKRRKKGRKERRNKMITFFRKKRQGTLSNCRSRKVQNLQCLSNSDIESLALDLPNNTMIGEFLAWALLRHNCGQIFPHMFTEFRKYRNSC